MKKFLSVLLCAVLLAGSAVVGASAFTYGDVDGAGGITSGDARLVLRYSVGLETFTDEQLLLADVDANGMVNSSDARLILRGSVGLEETSQFGLNGSQIFASGVYSMEAVVDAENGTKFVVANTEDSTYLEASLSMDNFSDEFAGSGKTIRIGFLTIGADVYFVLPDAQPVAYLLLDEKTSANFGLDAEIFKNIIPEGITDAVARDPDRKTTVSVNGRTYNRWIFENEDGSYVAHDMYRGKELQYIRTFDADGNESSVLRINSIEPVVPEYQYKLVSGGKLFASEEGDEDDTGYILGFFMVLAELTGISTDDLINGNG